MAIFFVVIFVIIITSMLLVLYSTLKFNIVELELINTKVVKFKLIISLALFNKINWLRLTIDNNENNKVKDNVKTFIINKILNTKILQKYKNIQKVLTSDSKKIRKVLDKIEIEKLELKAKIGTENAAITAITTGTISAIISIILARKVSNLKYLIEPEYINKNYIYLSLNCIIGIKVVHIINMRKELKRKEVYPKYGRTSNRRSYANSNG